MMLPVTIWNGSKDEANEFSAAAINNCDCEQTTGHVCATHRDMKTDQQYLDTLIFYRRNRDRLNAEERMEAPPNEP